MDQRSDEWLAARCGSLGASQAGVALERLKRGDRSAAAIDLLYELAAERLTGLPAKRVNARDWGIDHEPEARAAYAFLTNEAVTEVGLVRHPTIAYAHCSPDALIGDDGGLEIKCPTSGVHLRTIIEDAIPEKHLAQLHWSMACTGRRWWDFMSFDPRFPEGLQFFIRRLERDDKIIASTEKEAEAFLAEIDAKLSAFMAQVEAA